MEEETIKTLIDKQHGKCSRCGKTLLGTIHPLENEIVCRSCYFVTDNKKPKEYLEKPLVQESNSNKITVVEEKKEQIPYSCIYQWSSELTSEMSTEEGFLWTPEMKNLLRRLTLLHNQFIAVIGLQGVGKTRLREALYNELTKDNEENAYFIKGNSLDFLDFTEKMRKDISRNFEIERPWEELKRPFWREMTSGKIDNAFQIYKKHFGTKKYEKIIRETILGNIADSQALLWDLPDYDKTARGQMLKDLQEIQKIWEEMSHTCGDFRLNLVVFMQKELFHGHFLFGKFDVWELKPFTVEQLTGFFKQKFGSTKPFTEEALKEIASLSRGIFRRFKKYTRISLESWYNEESENDVTLENIKEWISLDQLVKDMELELCDLFPKSKELLKKCVILLRFLREHGSTTQTAITNNLFEGYKMGCSRLLGKLEAEGYLSCEKKGKEKIWSLRG